MDCLRTDQLLALNSLLSRSVCKGQIDLLYWQVDREADGGRLDNLAALQWIIEVTTVRIIPSIQLRQGVVLLLA